MTHALATAAFVALIVAGPACSLLWWEGRRAHVWHTTAAGDALADALARKIAGQPADATYYYIRHPSGAFIAVPSSGVERALADEAAAMLGEAS